MTTPESARLAGVPPRGFRLAFHSSTHEFDSADAPIRRDPDSEGLVLDVEQDERDLRVRMKLEPAVRRSVIRH